MKYNRGLMMCILHDKVRIADAVNATVIPLDAARRATGTSTRERPEVRPRPERLSRSRRLTHSRRLRSDQRLRSIGRRRRVASDLRCLRPTSVLKQERLLEPFNHRMATELEELIPGDAGRTDHALER